MAIKLRCVFSNWLELLLEEVDNKIALFAVALLNPVLDDCDEVDSIELDCWDEEIACCWFWLLDEPLEEPTELAGDGGGISLGLVDVAAVVDVLVVAEVANEEWRAFWLVDKALLDLLIMLLLIVVVVVVLELILFVVAADEESVICLYSLIDSLVRRISLRLVSQSHL